MPEEQELSRQTSSGMENLTDEQRLEAYNKLATEAPPREVELPKSSAETVSKGSDGHNTLSEGLGSSEDLTDMQAALAKLFPTMLDSNSVMVGRIDPSLLLSMLHLKSVGEIMRSDPTKPIDVDSIWLKNYVLLSIGLDGRGRIDIAEIAGAAREEKRADKLLGGLGRGI